MLRRGLCWLLCAAAAAMSWLLCAAAFYRYVSMQTLRLKIGNAHRQMLANGAPCECLVIPCASARTLARAVA